MQRSSHLHSSTEHRGGQFLWFGVFPRHPRHGQKFFSYLPWRFCYINIFFVLAGERGHREIGLLSQARGVPCSYRPTPPGDDASQRGWPAQSPAEGTPLVFPFQIRNSNLCYSWKFCKACLTTCRRHAPRFPTSNSKLKSVSFEIFQGLPDHLQKVCSLFYLFKL
jgi:hypothetical protein